MVAAVALFSTFAIPLARGAKDDMMKVSWTPSLTKCKRVQTQFDVMTGNYIYQGTRNDGNPYYARVFGGKRFYLYYESACEGKNRYLTSGGGGHSECCKI